MRKERETRSFAVTLKEMLEREGMQELGDLLRIRESWVEIAGEDLAGKTKPFRLERGRLYVGVDSHAVMQNALFCVEEIKRGVKDGLGMEIGEIFFKRIKLK